MEAWSREGNLAFGGTALLGASGFTIQLTKSSFCLNCGVVECVLGSGQAQTSFAVVPNHEL